MHVIHSQYYPCVIFKVPGPRGGGCEADRRTRAAEEEKDTCDLEVMSQSLILPPTDRPYFLLLQGYDQSKARHASNHLSYSHPMTSFLYSSNHNIPSKLYTFEWNGHWTNCTKQPYRSSINTHRLHNTNTSMLCLLLHLCTMTSHKHILSKTVTLFIPYRRCISAT